VDIRAWALRWLALLALWLIVAGSATALELLVGVVAALVGATVWAAVLPTRSPGPTRRGVVRWSRLPGRVLADTWVVLSVLARRVRGRPVDSGLRLVRFDPGGATHGVAAVATMSLAANSYVVDIDVDEGVLLLPQLDRRAPGAGDVKVLRR